MNLYEIASDYERVQLAIEEAENIDALDLIGLLGKIDMAFGEKVLAVARMVKNNLAEANAIKQEEARLSARRKARENAADRLKTWLCEVMQIAAKDKIKDEILTVTCQNSPPSVQVLDWKAIPQEYFRSIEIDPSTLVDKKAVVEHFKETGEIVPGVEIDATKKHVVIR